MRFRSSLSVLIFSIGLAAVSSMARAQPGGNSQMPGAAVSHADGTVTFTYPSATAKGIKLIVGYPFTKGGGMGPSANRSVDMTRDDKGVWSVTLGPVPADIYSYSFNVDGQAQPAKNLLMKAPETANYETNPNIDHGTVSKVWYSSKIFSNHRRMVIYTPPGYETSTARYPVLYLLHGGGGDELTWAEQGRGPQIFDALIAQGKMIPSIVVMTHDGTGTNGFTMRDDPYAPQATPMGAGGAGRPGIGPGGPGGPEMGGGQGGAGGMVGMQGSSNGKNPRVEFLKSLTDEVTPFIDKVYRTKAGGKDRAVAGFSGGAGESIIEGLNNPTMFSYIGAFSPGRCAARLLGERYTAA